MKFLKELISSCTNLDKSYETRPCQRTDRTSTKFRFLFARTKCSKKISPRISQTWRFESIRFCIHRGARGRRGRHSRFAAFAGRAARKNGCKEEGDVDGAREDLWRNALELRITISEINLKVSLRCDSRVAITDLMNPIVSEWGPGRARHKAR